LAQQRRNLPTPEARKPLGEPMHAPGNRPIVLRFAGNVALCRSRLPNTVARATLTHLKRPLDVTNRRALPSRA